MISTMTTRLNRSLFVGCRGQEAARELLAIKEAQQLAMAGFAHSSMAHSFIARSGIHRIRLQPLPQPVPQLLAVLPGTDCY